MAVHYPPAWATCENLYVGLQLSKNSARSGLQTIVVESVNCVTGICRVWTKHGSRFVEASSILMQYASRYRFGIFDRPRRTDEDRWCLAGAA